MSQDDCLCLYLFVFVDCRDEDGDGCDSFEIFCYCGVIGGLSCESRGCSRVLKALI